MKDLLARFKNRLDQSQRLVPLRGWLSQSFRNLKAKGRHYWLLAAFLLPTGMLLGDLLGKQSVWVTTRYYVYNVLQKAAARPITSSTRTLVVLIDDEEYWKGALARRTPLKRDYLARLLLKLDQTNPAVIALDVDLAAQTADKSVIEHPDYQAETNELLTAIKTVSKNRPVVLPRTLFREGLSAGVSPETTIDAGSYEPEPTVYDGYDFETNNILTGYVSLPYDVRQVPLTLPMKDGSEQDSFAAAIVKRLDQSALRDAQSDVKTSLPYGTFIPPTGFTSISAKQILESNPDTLKPLLAANAVLVGGSWHTKSFKRGRQVDTHLTPVGEIGGVFVHANYVEALLTHRVSPPIGKVFGVTIETAFAVLIAIVFAWKMKPSLKFVWAVGLSLILIVITYVFWQNLGLFFDFFIPLILLGGHAFVAQVIEWREEAHPANAT
jgi:CHASE2 domain-containing sensor protein